MTRPRLIVTDLDGTFLGPDRLVSATNLAAARRAAELGIPFMVATGRPVRWLDVLDQLAEAHSQVIVSNGAAVFDLASREVVRSFPLDASVALAVADGLREAVPGITFGFETASRLRVRARRHRPGNAVRPACWRAPSRSWPAGWAR